LQGQVSSDDDPASDAAAAFLQQWLLIGVAQQASILRNEILFLKQWKLSLG
jgi:hypothetical protein